MPLTPLPTSGPPGGRRTQKLGDLLTVCIKVLPDFQELGCCQLGQVQVRGLLLRASHGEPLLEILSRSALSPGAARLRFSLWGCAPRCLYKAARSCTASGRRQGARTLRESRRARRCTGGGWGSFARVPGGPPRESSARFLGACREHHRLFGGNGRGCSCLPSLCPSRGHPVTSRSSSITKVAKLRFEPRTLFTPSYSLKVGVGGGGAQNCRKEFSRFLL